MRNRIHSLACRWILIKYQSLFPPCTLIVIMLHTIILHLQIYTSFKYFSATLYMYLHFIRVFHTETRTDYWPSSFQLCMSQPRVKPWTSPRCTGTVQFCPMKQAMMSVPPVQVQNILLSKSLLYSDWTSKTSFYKISQKKIQNPEFKKQNKHDEFNKYYDTE